LDKRYLYDNIEKIEASLKTNLEEVRMIKIALQEVAVRNTELMMENQKLRERLQQLHVEDDKSKEKSKAVLNLEKLYEEGFHICNEFYSQRRLLDEECLMCLAMIDRKLTKE